MYTSQIAFDFWTVLIIYSYCTFIFIHPSSVSALFNSRSRRIWSISWENWTWTRKMQSLYSAVHRFCLQHVEMSLCLMGPINNIIIFSSNLCLRVLSEKQMRNRFSVFFSDFVLCARSSIFSKISQYPWQCCELMVFQPFAKMSYSATKWQHKPEAELLQLLMCPSD